MSKRIRLFIVLVVLIICGSFLYPTIQWYFRIPEQEKELAASSRQNIRDYAEKMAAEKLRTLKNLASESDETDLPEEFSFMTDQAEENYELRDERTPRIGRSRTFFEALPTKRRSSSTSRVTTGTRSSRSRRRNGTLCSSDSICPGV